LEKECSRITIWRQKKANKRELTETRIPLRKTIYCLKITVRWIYE